jgi:transcriptional regulator with XRE-family HTH domain
MAEATKDAVRRRAALARTVKALRRRRGLTAADVAVALGMPLRSYEHFEAGRTRINVDRIHQVCEMLDADANAVLAAIELDAPNFAVHCADNKLMSLLLIALQEFEKTCGSAMVQLDPSTLMEVFSRTFQDLAEQARKRAALSTLRTRPAPRDEG